MRLFILTVTLVLVPTVLSAQHSSTTSSSSSSSSSSSASSSSSTTHSSSAPSFSSGSSSSSSSFSSASSPSTPSVSSSHVNSTPTGSGSSLHSGASSSSVVEPRSSDSAARRQETDSSGQRELKETHSTETKDTKAGIHADSIKDAGEPGRGQRTDIDANLGRPSDTIPDVRVVKQPNGDRSGYSSDSERLSGGDKLRHLPCGKEPCRNHEPTPEPKPGGGARIVICEVGPCRVCPPGHYPGKNGVCTASFVLPAAPPVPYARPKDNDDYYLYPAQRPDALENCSLFATEGTPLVAELRMLKSEILDKCSQGIEPDCSDAKMRQQAALLEYSGLLTRTPFKCQAFLPSYISLM